MVGADTVQRPGGDAAVVRVHGTQKALAMTTDCTPRYCFADPVMGGRQAVAEAWRNLSAVGATPLAVTNCLNFANPQRPEIMGQIVGCLEGMSEACIALDFPIVSGNVSLYNESKATGGGSRDPADPRDRRRRAARRLEQVRDHRLQGLRRHHPRGRRAPRRPRPDALAARMPRPRGRPPAPRRSGAGKSRGRPDPRRHPGRASSRRSTTCRDGGVAVTLAEMALAGGIGAIIDRKQPFDCAHSFFAEDQGVYVVTVDDTALMDFLQAAHDAGVEAEPLGRTGGKRLIFERPDRDDVVTLDALRAAHEGFFPKLMGEDAALA